MAESYTLNTDTGTITTDTEDLLNTVIGEWTSESVFGTNLDTDASTPQGILIRNETIARTSVMKNNADMANTLNPDQSYGVFLGSICKFLGYEPTSNSSTIGTLILFTNSGTTNITIPSGYRVQTTAGDIFTVISDVSITALSTATGSISAQEVGAIPLPVGDLTIVDGVIGWGAASVQSSSVVNLGTLQQTDAQVRTQREKMLYRQGIGSIGAIQGSLLSVNNVTSVKIIENDTGVPGTYNGITFALNNSIWICVAGEATEADIGAAIYASRQACVPYEYGATGQGNPVGSPDGILVTDPYSNQQFYVKYTTPILMDCYVHITATQGTSIASEISIQNAIVNYSQGLLSGQEGFVVGADVSSYLISSAAVQTFPGLIVSEASVAVVTAGSAAPIWPAGFVSYFSMEPYQQAQLASGNITVALS